MFVVFKTSLLSVLARTLGPGSRGWPRARATVVAGALSALVLAQTASLIGLWGMTFLTIALFASPALLLDRVPPGQSARGFWRAPWLAPAMAIGVLIVMGAPSALPLVCYESIYPLGAAAHDQRPGWIVNVSNDGWLGATTGPYQHLQQARMRAIEQGLPLVRDANGGVSAVFDPVGRSVAQLGFNVEGVLDADLPAAIEPTLYARLGDTPAGIVIALVLIVAVRGRWAQPQPCRTPAVPVQATATRGRRNRS
jgi:apolipoprotein N-acyltransferase